MWETIGSWLIATGIKDVLNWALAQISAMISAFQKDKADQKADADQAAVDTEKASKITPDSSAKDVSDAINDELSHL